MRCDVDDGPDAGSVKRSSRDVRPPAIRLFDRSDVSYRALAIHGPS
jgi:hypothetical protein